MSEYPMDDELLLAVRAARPAFPEEAVSLNGATAKEIFERVVVSADPDARTRPGGSRPSRDSVLGSRGPGRRAVAIVPVLASVLVVVLVAALALTALKHGHASGSAGTGTHTTGHYTSPEGWSIEYAASMRLTRSTARTGPFGSEVSLTSFPAPRKLRGHPRSGERENPLSMPFDVPLDSGGKFPADGVALVLQPSPVGFLGPDSRFPITLNEFGAPKVSEFFSRSEYAGAAIPPARSRAVIAYSQEVTMTALIGRDASAAVRRQLASAIASLSFPRLRPGTHVGAAVVLGPASDYPVGSFAPVQVQFGGQRPERVYVVHAPGRLSPAQPCAPTTGPCVAPGAFYGMGSQYNTRVNHAPQCDLRLDRRHDDFYCTNLAVRWDRVGRVISRPANESYIGSIEGLYAKVAWDGQILLIDGWGPEISQAAVHRLWPTWNQGSH